MSFNIEDYPDMDRTSLGISRKAPPRGQFAPTEIPQLTREEAELFLRSLSFTACKGYKISNIPKDAQSIHRAVKYFHETLNFPQCDLPFKPEDDLDIDVYKWAHSTSSRNRPALVLFSDRLMYFTASGTDPTGRDLAIINGEHPHLIYSEHRVTLHRQMVQPRQKPGDKAQFVRPIPKTNLVHHQAYSIPPSDEPLWRPVLYLAGLGHAFAPAKGDITLAVHAFIRSKLVNIGRSDLAQVYLESAQLTWHYVQFPKGDRSITVPVADLRLRHDASDPAADHDAIFLFAAEAPNLILSFLFGTSPADHIEHSFLGIRLRVIRASIGPLLASRPRALDAVLALAPPSMGVFSVTLYGLVPHPSLSMIFRVLSSLGLSSIETIVNAHEEETREPRPDRRTWLAPTHVRVILTSAAEARIIHTDPHAQMLLSSSLGHFLQHQGTVIHAKVFPVPTMEDTLTPGSRRPVLTPTYVPVNPRIFSSKWGSFDPDAVGAHLHSLLLPDHPTVLALPPPDQRPQHNLADSPALLAPRANHSPPNNSASLDPQHRFQQLQDSMYAAYTEMYAIDPSEAHIHLVSMCAQSSAQMIGDGYLLSQEDDEEEEGDPDETGHINHLDYIDEAAN
jgi:hypothetical protein